LNGKFDGRRPVGRPWLRWEYDIRRDFLLLLNVRGWRRLAGDRCIWRYRHNLWWGGDKCCLPPMFFLPKNSFGVSMRKRVVFILRTGSNLSFLFLTSLLCKVPDIHGPFCHTPPPTPCY